MLLYIYFIILYKLCPVKGDVPDMKSKLLFVCSDFALAWRCHTHNSSQNVSLRPLHWAVIMGRVSTEPGNKMPLRSIG